MGLIGGALTKTISYLIKRYSQDSIVSSMLLWLILLLQRFNGNKFVLQYIEITELLVNGLRAFYTNMYNPFNCKSKGRKPADSL